MTDGTAPSASSADLMISFLFTERKCKWKRGSKQWQFLSEDHLHECRVMKSCHPLRWHLPAPGHRDLMGRKDTRCRFFYYFYIKSSGLRSNQKKNPKPKIFEGSSHLVLPLSGFENRTCELFRNWIKATDLKLQGEFPPAKKFRASITHWNSCWILENSWCFGGS